MSGTDKVFRALFNVEGPNWSEPCWAANWPPVYRDAPLANFHRFDERPPSCSRQLPIKPQAESLGSTELSSEFLVLKPVSTNVSFKTFKTSRVE